MTRLLSLLLIISLPFFAVAQNGLKHDLKSLGLTVYFPGDSAYANASQAYNRRFTVKPAAVIYPKTPQDVAAVIKVSSANGNKVVARSGGHSYVANGLGGVNNAVVVDLKNFNKISVSSASGTATIQTGNRLGDVALALIKSNRALPHGTCPYVGIGGHSGHGGFGFTSRMWGLTLDNVLSAEVVLANGTIVTASNTSHPDLYWAIRGSSSSFGIVTSINVKTYPAPPYAKAFQYVWQLNYTQAADGLDAYQTFVTSGIPPEFGAEVNIRKGNKNGTVSFALVGGWYGDKSGLNKTVKPLLDKMPKQVDVTLSGNGTYIDTVVYFGGGGSLDTHSAPDVTDTFYAKSLMTPEAAPLTANARLSFMKHLAIQGFATDLAWFMQVELYGGSNSAINKVPVDSTSFGRRNSMFTWQLYASSHNKAPPYPNYGFTFVDGAANSVTSNMPTNWDYGAYLNYIDDKLANWQHLYYGTHYSRLQLIKKQVDPHNIFKFPESVEE